MTEPSESDKQLKDELEKLNQERQLILTRMERKTLEKINQIEEQAESSASSSTTTSTSSRKRLPRNLANEKVKLLKLSAKDSITIAGIQGTLGSCLLELGETLQTPDKKSRYMAYLCKNGIVDMTRSSDRNQMDVIGGKHVKSIMTKYLNAFGGENNSDNNIDEVTKPLSKLKNKRKMEEFYDKHLVRYKPKNDIERNVLNIYKYIMEQHVFRSFMFTRSYINSCSEQSLNIKYWSYLFESFFGRNKDVFLQWGETKAVDCTRAALDFKLDLRIIVNIEQEKHEVATAELAKPRSTIESKLFNDKLKLVLVTKCHLNSVLKTMPYIPKSKVKDVKVPIVQIMGLTCHVQALSLIDKGVYLLQDVCSVDYPQTHAQVEAKGLQKVIEAFSIIDDLIIDITEYHRDYNVDQSSKMDSLTKGKKKNNVNIEDWVSEVVCDDDMVHDN